MKPRVLVLTSTYPRWDGDVEPAFVHELARRLTASHEVHVLAPHYKNASTSELMDGVHVHRFRYCLPSYQRLAYQGGMMTNMRHSPWLLLLLPIFLLSQFVSAFSLVRKHNIDLIHAHWVIPQGLVALVLRYIFRHKVLVVTSHGADVYALNGGIWGRLKTWVYDMANAVTVVSQAMADRVSLTVDCKKLLVAPMGVDLESTFIINRPIEERVGVVFVGRLVEKKGAGVLLAAFEKLTETNPGLRLTIVGDGPDKSLLIQQAIDLGVACSVDFYGAVPNDQIPVILNQHSIAIVPSIVASSGDQEGLGLVSIEAMGCGCAVIASDLPAIHDVVDHMNTGLMFEMGNSGALADVIRRLVSDDSLRCDLALRGNRMVNERFDWSKAAERYIDLFSRL